MAIFAYHDENGKVRSLLSVSAPPGAGVVLVAAPGLAATQVEGLDSEPDARDFEKLRVLAKTQKVASPSRRSKLVKNG